MPGAGALGHVSSHSALYALLEFTALTGEFGCAGLVVGMKPVPVEY